jgi:peroxiredoxin
MICPQRFFEASLTVKEVAMTGRCRWLAMAMVLGFSVVLLGPAYLLGGEPGATGQFLGRPAPQFQLVDSEGKTHALAEWRDARLVVVAFLGTECPLAQRYAARLNELTSEYTPKGVRFVAIDSNVQDTSEKTAAFVHDYALRFPLLLDPDNRVADQFGAVRTPEVFLIDGQRIIRYRGRVDDQYGIGVQKSKPGRRDLAVALDELLAGRAVSQPELPARGCFIGRAAKPAGSAEVTYSQQIVRILQHRCVECHRKGEIAPFALTSYHAARAWSETIREVVEQGRMPPWFADPQIGHFSNDARLSEEEKQLIARWVAAGCPEGNPQDLPPPRTFVEGWKIPPPQLVLNMSAKPFPVPAQGSVPYKHFVVDPGFKEDKWVVASEARPGNRSVVHHILVFLQRPGKPVDLFRGALLAGYAPGAPGRVLQPGMGLRIPAGSKIIFQVHYTPRGVEQEDCSKLGLVFCDAKDVKQEVQSGVAGTFFFAIPPGAKQHRMTAEHRFREDCLLFNLTPHMHMRGKTFRYEVLYPDGRKETLLYVPHWDFNWQIEYNFVQPKRMPKGAVLLCTAEYDNSAENPSNPDPTQWVTFGEQTWDEMLLGWFVTATLPREAGIVQASKGDQHGHRQSGSQR